MSDTSSVTGRDGLILAKALAYAIEAIERLPKRWREQRDQSDMIKLLEALQGPKVAHMLRIQARSHLERRGLAVRFGTLELAEREQGPVVPFPK